MPEISDEFTNRIFIDGKITDLGDKPISPDYDKDEYNPVDGKLIEVCDKIAAYMEAAMSEEYGITSKNLQKSVYDLRNLYEKEPVVQGVNVYSFF
jgi:putative hydrolase of HD superfamily